METYLTLPPLVQRLLNPDQPLELEHSTDAAAQLLTADAVIDQYGDFSALAAAIERLADQRDALLAMVEDLLGDSLEFGLLQPATEDAARHLLREVQSGA